MIDITHCFYSVIVIAELCVIALSVIYALITFPGIFLVDYFVFVFSSINFFCKLNSFLWCEQMQFGFSLETASLSVALFRLDVVTDPGPTSCSLSATLLHYLSLVACVSQIKYFSEENCCYYYTSFYVTHAEKVKGNQTRSLSQSHARQLHHLCHVSTYLSKIWIATTFNSLTTFASC